MVPPTKPGWLIGAVPCKIGAPVTLLKGLIRRDVKLLNITIAQRCYQVPMIAKRQAAANVACCACLPTLAIHFTALPAFPHNLLCVRSHAHTK